MGRSSTVNIKQSLESMIEFERAFSDYYKAMAEVCPNYSDFWQSAAIQKETRLNLYSSILNDYSKNKFKYSINDSSSGHLWRLIEKIRTSSQRILESRNISNEHLEFIFQLEKISHQSGSFPQIAADTEIFEKANLILERMQKQQLRLVASFMQEKRECNRPGSKTPTEK